MLIDGKALAADIINELSISVTNIKKRGILPKIAIVTLGDEETWKAYVDQKIKLSKILEVDIELVNLKNVTQSELISKLDELNKDTTIYGIIVQRPFPSNIDNEIIINAIEAHKDIDGFALDSDYEVPVWLAVKRILKEVYTQSHVEINFIEWLKSKNIVIVGKGITAGKPIEMALLKLSIKPIIVRSGTQNVQEILKNADIIISAVGKTIIDSAMVKKGVVLVGVGLHRGADGKLHGDYENVSHVAAFYTPSPGGVGPLNLAYLFKNLLSKIQ